ncbi:release factor glutamine methyltransferase [Halomonas elongata]|uniref:Release factor glutamine methyltransferase n=1 Tax=Halomonas elongata TaxID=2746 RepID=A0A1B8P4X4_HALEL|nr:release factor glutamine methyltransferase [Halomonas elongata]
MIAARAAGQPVAYLTGEREFWGLSLLTGPSTLIPRPDTETLVAAALSRMPARAGRLLDLGTGSGAVALALASERPDWYALGIDLNPDAVALARRNAERLGIANVGFRVGDWFAALDESDFDVIVANPPIWPTMTRTSSLATCVSNRVVPWWRATRGWPISITWSMPRAIGWWRMAGCCWSMVPSRGRRCARPCVPRDIRTWPASRIWRGTSGSVSAAGRGAGVENPDWSRWGGYVKPEGSKKFHQWPSWHDRTLVISC